jgi:hypothetical protein
MEYTGSHYRPQPQRRRVRLTTGTALAAIAVGVVLRGWYLAHDPITSDEAVVGLMARGILQGHFTAFYWGQPYGGAEPYVVAAMFGLFGQTGTTIQASAALLAVVAAVLAWRVALRLVSDRRIALLTAALVWVAPCAYVYNSTFEYGFRGVTMIAGLAALLFALRALDREALASGRAVADFAGLGLALGLGWWASPEIAYFAVPAGLIVVGALRRQRLMAWRSALPVLTAVVAFFIGGFPWWWANVQSGFASLTSGTLQNGLTAYGGRLHSFSKFSGPIETGLKVLGNGARPFGNPGSPGWQQVLMDGVIIATTVVLGGSLLLCLFRRGRAVAIAIGVAAFPFLYAEVPDTWFWKDGRYVVYLGPLLALMTAIGVEQAYGRIRTRPAPRRGASMAMAGILVVSTALTLAAFHTQVRTSNLLGGWGDPDRANEQAVTDLEGHDVDRGYANYWVAYDVDFFSRGRLAFTTIGGEINRSSAINREALKGTGQAWLFEAPCNGPTGMLEATLTAWLESRHIAYTVFSAGRITAVVPSATVTSDEGLQADPTPTTCAASNRFG